MEVLALGLLEVRGAERRAGPSDLGGRKPKQVLELLAAAGGHPVIKEALIERLWGERPPRHPVAALENHVWVLRSHLVTMAAGQPTVVVEGGGYALSRQNVTLDLVRFDELARASRVGTSSQRRASLEEALSLVRGEVFEDEPYAEWATGLRETYRARVAELRLELAEIALAADDLDTATDQSERVLAANPLSERGGRVRMLALAGRGERERALQVFAELRRDLRAELALDPLPETVEVCETIREGGGWTVSPPPRGERPNRIRVAGALPASPATGPTHEGSVSVHPPLRGRRDVVRELAETIERALTRRSPTIVLVEGLAHVGKSRVVSEACRSLSGVRSAQARFSSATRGLSLTPILASLRTLGSPVDGGPPGNANVADELRGELERYAPLVLVLDDLHEADVEMIRTLYSLTLTDSTAPVVIVGVFRSEEIGPRHPLRQLEGAARVRLSPLRAAELGPDAPAVLARTGGYGAYVVAWARGERTGPPNPGLRDAVLARCLAAGPRVHRILVAASSLPEPLSVTSITGATGVEQHRVAEDLDRAVVRGLLRELDGYGFGFACTLVADALRTQVSSSRQRVLLEHGGASSTPRATSRPAAGWSRSRAGG